MDTFLLYFVPVCTVVALLVIYWPGYGFADWQVKQAFGDTSLPFGNDTDVCKDKAGLWQA